MGRRGDQEIQRRVHDAGERLVHLARMMEVMSHRNVLARGYMIARNEKGDVVTLSQIEGPSFWLEDAGGRAEATIIKKA